MSIFKLGDEADLLAVSFGTPIHLLIRANTGEWGVCHVVILEPSTKTIHGRLELIIHRLTSNTDQNTPFEH